MSAAKWILDNSHSELGFKIKHLMISTVSGSFTGFSVDTASSSDDFSDASIQVSVDVKTIHTKNEQRDGHLVSGDFFDAEKYPAITFTSTKMEKKSNEEYALHGNLTIRDVTQPITLQVEFNGLAKDPWGNIKAAFSFNGKINRKEFGLTYNAALETGGMLLGEEVKIQGEIQLQKQTA